MKKLIIFCALIMSIITTSFSQKNDQHKEKKEALIKELNLNESQQTSMKAILKDAHEAKKANQTAYINDKKSLHKANKLLKIATEEKIKNILTPEQFAKFKSFKENNHKEKVLKKADEMSTILKLSPDQKDKYYILVAEFDNKIQENKKRYANDEEKLKIENRDLRKNFKSKLSAILTPEQLLVYKNKQKERHTQQ